MHACERERKGERVRVSGRSFAVRVGAATAAAAAQATAAMTASRLLDSLTGGSRRGAEVISSCGHFPVQCPTKLGRAPERTDLCFGSSVLFFPFPIPSRKFSPFSRSLDCPIQASFYCVSDESILVGTSFFLLNNFVITSYKYIKAFVSTNNCNFFTNSRLFAGLCATQMGPIVTVPFIVTLNLSVGSPVFCSRR